MSTDQPKDYLAEFERLARRVAADDNINLEAARDRCRRQFPSLWNKALRASIQPTEVQR